MHDAFIPGSSRRGQGRCFGFFQFGHRRVAMKAVSFMDSYRQCGRRLIVKLVTYGQPQRSRQEKEVSRSGMEQEFSFLAISGGSGWNKEEQ